MPYAEELIVGVPLPTAPSITLDDGMAAQYQAIIGDSLRAPLSEPLSRSITRSGRLVNPALALQVAIGQSTVATRLVIANLFYRNVVLHQQVMIGQTLTTEVTPLAAARTRQETRAKVLLGMKCTDENGRLVADFQRLALLPVREPASFIPVGDIATAAGDVSLHQFAQYIPDWDLTGLLPQNPPHLPAVDTKLTDPMAETVSGALELVRLTQNMAIAHRDPEAGQGGKRLVYGGHTIGLAQASLTRQLPAMVTVLGWRSCDHLAPVFEGDVLDFSFQITDTLTAAKGTIVGLRVQVSARRAGGPVAVLDWSPIALFPTEIPI